MFLFSIGKHIVYESTLTSSKPPSHRGFIILRLTEKHIPQNLPHTRNLGEGHHFIQAPLGPARRAVSLSA